MSDVRGTVVSVRLSSDQQSRLRRIADARGTSVSELIRTYIDRALYPVARGESVSPSPVSDGYVKWSSPLAAEPSFGPTLTVRVAMP
jgi:hypothetical protein